MNYMDLLGIMFVLDMISGLLVLAICVIMFMRDCGWKDLKKDLKKNHLKSRGENES